MYTLIIHTISTAIKPPISLNETEYTRESTYNLSMTCEGTDTVYTYSVHTGAQFGVECSSIATIQKPFSGEVTWYKKVTVSGLYRHRYSMKYTQSVADFCLKVIAR